MSKVENWTEKWKKEKEEQYKKNTQVLEERSKIREMLLSLQVEKVTVVYNGEGDNGQIEEVEFDFDFSPSGIGMGEKDFIKTKVKELFYCLLDNRGDKIGDWVNNEGGYGNFIWYLPSDSLSHAHSQRTLIVKESKFKGWK